MKTSAQKYTLTITVAGCALLIGCYNPPSTPYYQSAPPPSTPALSSQEREEMDEGAIERMIQRGDEAYAREDYAAAKDLYYRAMLAQPDPESYVLASYAASLAHLGLFSNALEIFKIAQTKDPDNYMIRKNIAICEEIVQEEAMEKQAFEMQRRMTQIQDLLNLAGAVRDLNREVRQTVKTFQGGGNGASGSSATQNYAHTRAESGNDSKNDGSSGGGKGREYNCEGRGGARDRYRNAESAAQSAYKDLENSYDDMRKGKSASTAGYKENDLKKYQSNMKSIRQEASKNGCSISQSNWETKRPSRP